MNEISAAIIEELKLTYNQKLLTQNANFSLFAMGINKELDFLEIFTAIWENQKNNNVIKSNKLLKNEKYKGILSKDTNYVEFWRLAAITIQNLLIKLQTIMMKFHKIPIKNTTTSDYQKESITLITTMAPLIITKLRNLSNDLNQCAIKLPHFLAAKEHTPLSLFNFHNIIFNKRSDGTPYATLMENPYCSAILKAKTNNDNNNVMIEDALISKLDISYEELEAFNKATQGYEGTPKAYYNKNQPQQNRQYYPSYHQYDYQYDHNNNNNNYYRRGRGGRRGGRGRGRGGYQTKSFTRNNKNNDKWQKFCKKFNINTNCMDKNGKRICRNYNQEENCQNNCKFAHICARCQKDHPITKCSILKDNNNNN